MALIKLTKKEREVLDHLLDGLSQAEIAKYQNISISGVKKHVSSLLTKYKQPSVLKLVTEWYKDQLHIINSKAKNV